MPVSSVAYDPQAMSAEASGYLRDCSRRADTAKADGDLEQARTLEGLAEMWHDIAVYHGERWAEARRRARGTA